jgi:hypothetical protein
VAERTAVLVTGSRDWTDYGPIRERLALYPQGSILLHGNCGETVYKSDGFPELDWRRAPLQKGADKIAHSVGLGLGFYRWQLPYFADLGKRGGPARNECMFRILVALASAGHACFVEAFPIGESPGTRGMLRIVKSYNDAAFYDAHKREKHHEPIPVCVTEGTRV